MPHILIIGAGAIGAFYASRLAQVPQTFVSVICRSNYNTVSSEGFKILSPYYGDYVFKPHRVFRSPKEAAESRINFDFVVVSTKALPDVSDDSELLEGLLSANSSVVLIQNGLGVEEPYRKRFPKNVILSGVTIVSASQPNSGTIKHNRWTRISLGPFLSPDSSNEETERAMNKNLEFCDLLKAGGIKDADHHDHFELQATRWHKIAINASMNPSAVLSGGSTNREMVLDPNMREHLKKIMEEVLETAPKVLGRPLPSKLAPPEVILKSTEKNDSGSKPSMLLDWEQGKDMELEVILGNPIRSAAQKGIEMPRLQTMYYLLKKAQDNHRAQQSKSKL